MLGRTNTLSLRESIDLLYNALKNKKILHTIGERTSYNDEPIFYQYGSELKIRKKRTSEALTSSGFSFYSAEEALVKCLGEAAERYCLYKYDKSKIIFSSANKLLQQNPVDISLYIHDKNLNDLTLGWVRGIDANGMKCMIPAQLVYYGYNKKRDDLDLLQPQVSTGGAGEFSKTKALLSGIYEVVERDAFMTSYLNSVKFLPVSQKRIPSDSIHSIISHIKRYNIEPYIYDITNDLQIPVYCALLVDRTGIGPAFTIGAKAGFDTKIAILGAIAEACMMRPSIRYFKSQPREARNPSIIMDRAMIWDSIEKIKTLNFATGGGNVSIKFSDGFVNKKDELERVRRLLKDKGLKYYFADITLKEFRTIGYTVYKVIIPGLQPLYLHENEKKNIDKKRLECVASFFGVNGNKVNQTPHPFL